MQNESEQQQKEQNNFSKKIIKDIIELPQTNGRQTYENDSGAHFPNGVPTIDTVSLRINISARMNDVT